MTRTLFASLICLPLVIASASAQGFVNAKYGGEFLGFGVGARSAAMGGTGTGFANDVTAGYYNPSGLSLVQYPQFAALHESRYGGQINYEYLSGTLPVGTNQTFALSVLRLGLDDIKDSRNALIDRNGNGRLDEDDRIDDSKIVLGSAADWAFIGSYSRKVNEQLSLGGNLKVLHKSVLEHSAWGIGVDVAAMYRPTENLTMLGAILNDATKSLLSWDTGAQEFIVPTLRIGAGYKYEFIEDHTIMPVLDGIFRFEGRHETARFDLGITSLDIAGGLEYSFKNRLFVRGGYSELGQLTVGAGVKLPKLNIDYAFTNRSTDQDGFGQTHRISLMLTLEEPKYERAK